MTFIDLIQSVFIGVLFMLDYQKLNVVGTMQENIRKIIDILKEMNKTR